MVLLVGAFAIFFIPRSTLASTAQFYISPTGSDLAYGSLERPWKTLAKAAATIQTINRAMDSDIIVNLEQGIYELTEPFTLTADDSGFNGHKVIYQSYQNEQVNIRGGETVSGWVTENGLWKTNIGVGANFRQLWINGHRATRASTNQTFILGTDYWITPSGSYYFPTLNVSSWTNLSDIEFVANSAWKQFRCPVAVVASQEVTMQEPCWSNAHREQPSMDNLTYIENAFQFLDQPGEWYLNTTTGWLYYKPFSFEEIRTVNFTRPVLETIIAGDHVNDVTFQGITFEYATWNQPSTSEGYASFQANTSYTGTGEVTKAHANVTFTSSSNIHIVNSVFTHLGGSGINFDVGSTSNTITGNHFTDISGNAIQVGDIQALIPISSDNTVSNNYIHDVASEYQDAIGIWFGYAKNAIIENNELFNLPYTGISLGWGWGNDDPTEAGNNTIGQNYIHDHILTLNDGGGIYTLSAQPDSTISGNVIMNQKSAFGAIYLDTGSRFFTVMQNVCFNNLWSVWAKGGNNTLQSNYWQGSTQNIPDTYLDGIPRYGPNTFSSNTVIRAISEVPESIMKSAGVRLAFSSIKELSYPTNQQNICDQYGTSVELSWNAVNYQVLYDVRLEGQEKRVVSNTSLTVSISCDQQYHWWVANHDDVQHTAQEIFSCPCNPSERPDAPTGLFLTSVTSRSIGIMWQASTDHYGTLRYDVYRNGEYVGYTANVFYTDMNLLPNTSFSYTIVAVNTIGNQSEKSQPLSIDTPPEEVLLQGHSVVVPPAPAISMPTLAPIPKVLGDTIFHPIIKSLKFTKGAVSYKFNGKSITIRPFGVAYKGSVWARSIDFGPAGKVYIFMNSESYAKGQIKVFAADGSLLKAYNPYSEFSTKGLNATIVAESNSNVYLAVGSKKFGFTVKTYQVTTKGLRALNSLVASMNSGNIIVGFQNLYKNQYGLVTMKQNARSTLKVWKFDLKNKKFVEDKKIGKSKLKL